ncbi:MAG: phage tail protein I [Aestuariibacter sp.]|nr:phage tail protein I [Aestuariibacter sp.]
MTEPISSYMHYLPPIFQESEVLNGFLLAFERILTQATSGDAKLALETQIAQTETYLRPLPTDLTEQQAPAEFLPWLAGWVALTLRDDWPEDTQRRFIREIVPLYQMRGTKAGLKRMLEIYLGDNVPVTIYDRNITYTPKITNTLTFAPPPHFFQVQISVTTQDTDIIRKIQQITQAIIEQEKPAHTFYGLQIAIPTMRLVSESLINEALERGEVLAPLILGENTLLGTQAI